MAVTPARFKLPFLQGSTFDETWTLYDDDAETVLMDLTGYTAALKVRGALGAVALLSLTESGAAPPASDKLVLGGALGTVRVYVRDETMAALPHGAFTVTTEDDGTETYAGVWDLELTNAAGETFRYAMGAVAFSREVTHA